MWLRLHTGGAFGRQAHVSWSIHDEPAGQGGGGHRSACTAAALCNTHLHAKASFSHMTTQLLVAAALPQACDFIHYILYLGG